MSLSVIVLIKNFRFLTTQCTKYLTEGVPSPFNSVREHQHFASAIVMRTAAPPHITWTKDMDVVTCDGLSLNLSRWRDGLLDIMLSVENRIKKLTRGIDIPIKIPMSENMSKRTLGWSWIEMPNLISKPYPLLEILQDHPDFKICHLDRQGRLRWIAAGLMELEQEFAQLSQELAILCYMLPSPPPRGTELSNIHLRNTQIPRNIYKDDGTWIIYNYVKTTTLTDALSFLPSLCPPRLAQALDWYCVIARPVEILIAQQLYTTESKALYEKYLFCQHGEVMTSKVFSTLLSRYTEKHMGCAINLHTWRHMATAIQREYIGSQDDQRNNIGDILT